MEHWSDRLKRDREARGMSQLECVRNLRLNTSTALPDDESLLRSWKRWESGKIKGSPSAEYAQAIARMFGTVERAYFESALVPTVWTPPRDEETLDLVQSLRHSSVTEPILDRMRYTVDRLCTLYSSTPGDEVRAEAVRWMRELTDLLQKPISYRAHGEVLQLAGQLALLVSCLEQDAGLYAAAEASRHGAALLGDEVGSAEVLGWAAEIKAWMALTRGDYYAAIAAARAGRETGGEHSVVVQLWAQEAKAWARLKNRSETERALSEGREFMSRLPYPENPRNHFVVDPAKFDFYAMDCYRTVGEDSIASSYAAAVADSSTSPEGLILAPMRLSEAELTSATILARAGDISGALTTAERALGRDRQSLPSLLMVGKEFSQELARISEPEGTEFAHHLSALTRAG